MGPLTGFTIIEMAGIGPGPFCGMLLSDMGATVIRIDRKAKGQGLPEDMRLGPMDRGRHSIALDLKQPAAAEVVLKLVEQADAIYEGFRPGVMERLGLGPDTCLARNSKVVYGRMTGWGQTGPLAHAAGHDINYIAVSGALAAIGPRESPVPPLNLVGDFGGGALYLAMGMLAAMLEASRSGKGQVVDAAMTDGAASLMTMFYGMAGKRWNPQLREGNLLDGAAHFYGTYACADGKHIAIGSIEPQFYALLREKLGLADSDFDAQMDPRAWPGLRDKLAAVFKGQPRDHWVALMEGTDVCFAPVLDMTEAPHHPQNKARGAFVEVAGVLQPAPAPRFSRTASQVQAAPAKAGTHTHAVLARAGLDDAAIATLTHQGVI
jgi:alpha-methylacyl-CoA racemase